MEPSWVQAVASGHGIGTGTKPSHAGSAGFFIWFLVPNLKTLCAMGGGGSLSLVSIVWLLILSTPLLRGGGDLRPARQHVSGAPSSLPAKFLRAQPIR